jgi:hypothetical protein
MQSQHNQNIQAIMTQTSNTDRQYVRELYFKNNKDVTQTILEILGHKNSPKHVSSIVRTEEQKHIDGLRKILDEKDIFMENLKQQLK